MKYAVIQSGGKQYLVESGQELDVELVSDKKKLDFEPLITFDEKTAKVGNPFVNGAKVSAEVVDPVVAGDKIKIMKFKAKKREKTLTGHRQKHSRIKITSIS